MRFRTLVLTGAALVSIVAGCSSSSTDATTASAQSEETSARATITFSASGDPSLVGDLVEGSSVAINYDLSRITDCKSRSGDRDVWGISGFSSFNGKNGQAFDTSDTDESGSRRAKTAVIDLSEPGELALWFEISDIYGCHQYDSKLGANYTFSVSPRDPASGASIAFSADGTVKQTGTLHAGGIVSIDYDQARLSKCRGSSGEYPGWNITGFASIDGEQATTFETTTEDGSSRKNATAQMKLPKSGDLAIWFENTDLYGCNAYDSSNGQNYHFTIE